MDGNPQVAPSNLGNATQQTPQSPSKSHKSLLLPVAVVIVIIIVGSSLYIVFGTGHSTPAISTSIQPTSSTTPASVTPYTYAGNATHGYYNYSTLSVTLPSGYANYFCGGVVGTTGITATSWTADAAVGVTSVGHQKSPTCSISQPQSYCEPGYVGSCYATVLGVGVAASSYSLAASGNWTGDNTTFSYPVRSSSQYTYVVMATENGYQGGSHPVTLPSGCTNVLTKSDNQTEISNLAICSNQAPGTYKVSIGGLEPGSGSYAAYSTGS